MGDGQSEGRRAFLGQASAALALLAAFVRPQAGAGKKRKPKPRRAAGCAAVAAGGFGFNGTFRVAQLFSPTTSGSLRRVEVRVEKQADGADYVVQVIRAAGGVPSLKGFDVIAATVVPETSLPLGEEATLRAAFAGPRLEAGQTYAVVVSRPDQGLSFAKGDNGVCELQPVRSADGNNPVDPFDANPTLGCMLFGVFVAR